MKKKKKLFALLLSLCLAITMLPMATATAWAEEHTNHCVCGGSTNVGDHTLHPAVTWTAWNGTDEISYNDGNIAYVYLQQDTERSGALTVEKDKTLYLCLNGKTLTSKADSNTEGAITVSGTLYLCNCKATGGLSAAKNGVYVNVGGKFTQYNGNITGGASSGTGVFLRNYNGSGNFTMYGGTISGFKNSGVQVSDYGEFTMHNGTISGNSKSSLGGGVYVGSNAQFTMNDGTISQNNGSSYGGGVYTKGTFIMNNGKIEKNTSGYGGGVSVGDGGSFTMKNGLITKNSASSGGGVYLTSGSLAMNGGSITDNTATYNGGGVYYSGDSLNISGSSVINDNKKNGTFGADGTLTGGTDNNVYLPYSSYTVNIGTGGLTAGASIGVTTGTAPTVASPIAITGTNAADYSSYFFADDSSEYHIVNGDDNVVQLALGATQGSDSGSGDQGGNTEATHTNHCICGATHARIGDHDSNDSEANWTAWNQGANTNYETTLPTTSGYYYLTENVEVSSIGKIGSQNNNPGVDIKLCLNGHSIVSQSGSEVSVQIYTGSTLTLTDCKSAAGSVTHSNQNNQNNKRPGVLNYGTFNMYSGNITGNQGGGVSNYGTLNMYGGNIKNNSYSNNGAGVINGSDSSSANTATFNFYGGTISGNSATNGSGGGVYNASKGTFNMSGTALIGGTQDGDENTATQNGGGVCNKGTFNMTGGKILGNTATYHGGGVCNEGTFKISGDAQIGANTANSYGGGVYNYGAQNTFEMSDSAVIGDNNDTKGNVAKKGGGIYHGSGVLAITGGTIKNNKANGNSTQSGTYGGGGIYNSSNEATNSIKNVNISDNTAQYGGGIYMYNASTLALEGVTVKDNSATGTGSGLYISGENAKTTLKGDTKIIDNKDSADKGNVYLAEYGKITADPELSADSRIGIKSDEGNLNKTVVTGSTDTTIFTGETAGYILTSDSDGGLKLVDSSYEDEQVTPTPTPTPSGSGSWSSSHRSDNVINKSEDKTAGTAATTTATIKPSVGATAAEVGKTTAATVDNTTAAKIIDKAISNKSTEVIVNAATSTKITEAAAGSVTEIALPEKTVQELSAKTDASVTIKTDTAEVNLDKSAVDGLATQAGSDGYVKLIVETVKQEPKILELALKLITSKGTVTDFKGGNVSVKVKLSDSLASQELVCVYINDNGRYSKVTGAKNADRTYTFVTGHFSTYAIMAVDEANAVIAKQTEEVEALAGKIQLKARSAKTPKGNIKVTLKITKGADSFKALEDLGYTLKYQYYRSTEMKKNYKAKFETLGKPYTNTDAKKGTRYYYKARVVVYDEEGNIVTKTKLGKCWYATRIR